MLDNQKLKLEGAKALESKLKARPITLLLLVVCLSFILTACNNTNENSTAFSNTVVANQQAGGIKQLPAQPAADTPAPAPAQTTNAAAGGGGNATTAPADAGGSNAADVQAGLKLFQSNGCSGCHSNNGLAAGVGPKLQGDPIAKSAATIKDQIRNKAVAPMQKYPVSQISDPDLDKITTYILSLQSK